MFSLEIFVTWEIFQNVSNQKNLSSSKVLSIEVLHCFILMIFNSYNFLNHICCQSLNDIMILPNEEKLEEAPDKRFLIFLTVIDPGQVSGFKSIKPIQTENAATHKFLVQIHKLNWRGSLFPWTSIPNLLTNFLLKWSFCMT